MAWTMKVNLLESCSCAALCPCVLGPAKPDQEWCSGVFGMEVTEGDSDGVDLSGAKIVMHFELPGDFLGGIDKAKLYLDPSVSDASSGFSSPSSVSTAPRRSRSLKARPLVETQTTTSATRSRTAATTRR